jgi:hypothetical protein
MLTQNKITLHSLKIKNINARLKIAFINPPHADWSLANNATFLMMKSHYIRNGKYSDFVEWIPPLYKWNAYNNYAEIYDEVKEADVIMFSSYTWNAIMIDEICQYIKLKNPNILTIIGGPHIGTNEPDLLEKRYKLYDYICQPTKPGETFIEDFINSWFENNYKPIHADISWEIRSDIQRNHYIDKENYSVYEDNQEYLATAIKYAKDNKMEPFVIIETTRGCPYKCVFCEWGGGINTKIIKKDIDIVKRDILALINAGYKDTYLTDANFGVFEDRDIEIFRFGWQNRLYLSDISTVKSKDLKRRKRLVDKWFEVVGPGPDTYRKSFNSADMWKDTDYVSVVPTVSIQSISDEAMIVADRIDLSCKDKLELSKHINAQCAKYGYPIPPLELILAMPGSTIQDFYDEMELIWNFKAWGSFRHDYMFLPDSKLNSLEYKEKYKIETVDVYSSIIEEDGVDSWNNLYKNNKNYFKTIKSCYSFTSEEMKEMWFMNIAANYLLQYVYPPYENLIKPGEFGKICYKIIKQLDGFDQILLAVDNIFNTSTPRSSIRELNGRFRVEVIEELLKENELIIKNEVMRSCMKF